MSAFMQLVALNVHAEEDPNVILDVVDQALSELSQEDPDRTPEDEFRVVRKCREVLDILHFRFTPAEYRRLME